MKLTLTAVATFLSMTMFAQQAQQVMPNGSLQIENQRTANFSSTTSTAVGQIQSPNQGPTSAGNHVCKSHELNEKHYEERGILIEYNQAYLNEASNVNTANIVKTPGVNEVSVIFHVVHASGDGLGIGTNVSNADIMLVYDDIVEDFQLGNANAANARGAFGFVPADANINFCLATQDPTGAPLAEPGVIRVSTTEDWYNSDNGEENKMKASATGGSQIWDRNNYLNVWICDISNGAGSGTAGYAYRPTSGFLPGASIDGIVLDYNLGVNNENVLTHEIGHYLGLDHTWGGSGSCTSDDGFADTPNTAGPSFDFGGSCSGSQQTCGATETMYENYMDYANCTVMFTQDQSDYMLTILQGIRGTLLLSQGCDPTNTPPNSAFVSIPAGPGPIIIPVNGGVNFIDQSNNVPTGWAWTVSGTEGVDWNWINATTAASEDPQAEFYTVGLYDITLTASNSFGVDATPASEIGYVQVVAAATGLGCDTLRNYDPSATAWTYTWAAPSVGYIGGNTYLDPAGNVSEYAEYYAGATSDVRALEFLPVRVNDGGGSVIFKVWADNGGVPAAIPITTETVALADLTELTWNNIELTTPAVGVTTFWVGYEISYAGLDTFALAIDDTPVAQELFANVPGFGWINNYTGTNFASFMDVLTSTGPDPLADFTATTDSVCIGGDILVNGSGSTNVNEYGWYVTDNPFTTILEVSDVPTNTFNFPYTSGDYAIYLFGDGSCKTSAVFMPVVVSPSVAATMTPAGTTCGLNNGVITVSGEAGGDGTYYYSLDGLTYQTSPIFDSLPSGNYDVYVATFGNGCETMSTVNVAASAEVTAGVTANSSICPGTSAMLTATGGTTYSWYDGSTLIGSAASTTVTPATTTQYTCVVTNGGGCQSTVYTTVTVGPVITIGAITNPPVCSTLTGGIEITGGGTGVVYWTGTATANSGAVTLPYTITGLAAGSYDITFVDGSTCSSLSVNQILSDPTPPAAPTVTVSGATTFCAGGSVDLISSWATGNTWSDGDLMQTNTVTISGNYTVTYTDGGGCSAVSAPIVVTVVATPVIDPLGPVASCGSYALPALSGTDLTGAGAYYDAIGGPTVANVVTGPITSDMNIFMYDGASGCSDEEAVSITINALPTVTNVTGGATYCADGVASDVLVDVTGAANWSVDYTLNGATQNATGTVSPISLGNAAGVYIVNVVTDQNCNNTASGTQTIVVNALPTVSLGALSTVCVYNSPVTLTGGSPASGTYSGTSVTGTSFDPSIGAGSYDVTYSYTDANGCSNSAVSAIVVDGCAGIEEVSNEEVHIYPNPTDGIINIKANSVISQVRIFDAAGRLVKNINGNNQEEVKIEMIDLSSGLYNVEVVNASSVFRTQVFKN